MSEGKSFKYALFARMGLDVTEYKPGKKRYTPTYGWVETSMDIDELRALKDKYEDAIIVEPIEWWSPYDQTDEKEAL